MSRRCLRVGKRQQNILNRTKTWEIRRTARLLRLRTHWNWKRTCWRWRKITREVTRHFFPRVLLAHFLLRKGRKSLRNSRDREGKSQSIPKNPRIFQLLWLHKLTLPSAALPNYSSLQKIKRLTLSCFWLSECIRHRKIFFWVFFALHNLRVFMI